MPAEFRRIRRLPPYVFEEVNCFKARLRGEGVDIIDFGMGNPDMPTPSATARTWPSSPARRSAVMARRRLRCCARPRWATKCGSSPHGGAASLHAGERRLDTERRLSASAGARRAGGDRLGRRNPGRRRGLHRHLPAKAGGGSGGVPIVLTTHAVAESVLSEATRRIAPRRLFWNRPA